MIRIKPHHFLDIIKLYGKGIEKFVPEKNIFLIFGKKKLIMLKKIDMMLSVLVLEST